MKSYLSQLAQGLKPYKPGEQPRDRRYIKLNTNENPYPPAPGVLQEIQQELNNLHLYPDPNCTDLRDTVARYHGLKAGQVFIGNGSDEVLAFAFLAFFEPGKTILFPDITYSFYPVYCSIFEIDYNPVRLASDFSIPVEDFLQDNGGVIIPNPNAPTGRFLSLEGVEYILENNREQVVVVDEAYIDFGGDTAIPLLEKYQNLLIVRTLSKSRSLAGLRVGYALGDSTLISGLEKIKNSINSYTMDRLALAGAKGSFRDEDYFQEIRGRIINTRERIIPRLVELGFKVIPSRANFLFISHPQKKAREIFNDLKGEGILVRYFNQPRIDNHLRVSIGSDQEMDVFLEKLGRIERGDN